MRYVPGDVAVISQHDEPVFVTRHVPHTPNVFVRTLAPRIVDGRTIWRFGARGLVHEDALALVDHYPTFLAAAVFSDHPAVAPPRPIVYPWRYAEPGGRLVPVWTVRTPGRRSERAPEAGGHHTTYHDRREAEEWAEVWRP